MVVIDFHTHIFPPELIEHRQHYCARDRWFGLLYTNPKARMASAEDLVRSMDESGVDLSVAFGFAFADIGLCRLCNQYVLDAAKRFPERLIPFIVTNPAAGDPALIVAQEGLGEGGAGLGELMPAGQGYALEDLLLEPLMDLARCGQAPCLFHVNEQMGHYYPGKAEQGPQDAYQLAVHYPNNVLVFAHLGGGLPFYELMPEVRTALRNTYYDTAAVPYLYEDQALGHIAGWAADKILWGTDYPLISQKRFLRRLRKAGLDKETLLRLLGRNAYAVLGRSDRH